MGSACCSSDNPNATDQTQPEASKPERRKKKKYITKPIQHELSSSKSMETDSDYDTNDDYPPTENSNSLSNQQYVDDNHSLSSIPYDTPTTESAQKAIISFKNAVKNGNEALVIQLVDEYPSLELLEVEFINGDNALHVAVKNLSYNLILYLLTNGVSPNDPNQRNGDTALHTAVRTRDVKVVVLLTKYKADAKITNNKYETPLTIATDNKYYDIIELLSPETQSLVISHIQSHRKSADTLATDILSGADTIYNNDDSGGNQPNYVALKQPAMDNNNNKKKNDNPFMKLKRVTTKNVLHEMHNITAGKNQLPTLEAWLEKKQGQMPYNWQRRWVIVKDSHILWSDIQRTIKDPKSVKERAKFNNSINLMAITDIKPVTKSKSQRKFVICVGRHGVKNKTKEYLWKCATKNDRDGWVKGLQEHINHMKSMVMYFETP